MSQKDKDDLFMRQGRRALYFLAKAMVLTNAGAIAVFVVRDFPWYAYVAPVVAIPVFTYYVFFMRSWLKRNGEL